MGRILKQYYPVILSICVLWLIVFALWIIVVNKNQGNFVYVLDDAYIHMSVAKNFVEHGVFGITRYQFSSSSSSLLWTGLLIICFSLFGEKELIPFLMNILFASIFLLVFYNFLNKQKISNDKILLLLIVAILFIPLPLLIFTGLEHILHILLVVCFSGYALKMLYSRGNCFVLKDELILTVLGMLVIMSRYEGVFLIAVFSVLFIREKRLLYPVILVLASIVPIMIFGIYSIDNGSYLFPNSILLKGNMPGISLLGIVIFIFKAIVKLVLNLQVLMLILAGLIMAFLSKKYMPMDKRSVVMMYVLVSLTLLHGIFANFIFFRYEGYLIALGVLFVATTLHELFISGNLNKKFYLTALIFIAPFMVRAVMGLGLIPQASNNIYEQQYQMAMFVKNYYGEKRIAANDIGAINYYADIRNLDLWGIGSIDVAKAKIEKRYSTGYIAQLADKEKIEIAMIYDHWLDEYGGVPPQWTKVGEWVIANNKVCGGDTVSFYAINSQDADALKKNLQEYSRLLPADVAVK